MYSWISIVLIMTKITLKSKSREITGKKINKYRKEGLIPAVVYGRKIKSHNLWVGLLDFGKVYESAGESTIIELDIDEKKKSNVLIQDIQIDPITGKFFHIDFFQVRMDEKIEAEVPLEFIGESPAVKENGGILLKNADHIRVSCLPSDLPAKIEVDISKLKTFNDRIKLNELPISSKVKLLIDGEIVIAGVTPPRSEEELAKLDEKVEEDVTKVEGVIKETPASEAPEEGKMEANKEKKMEEKRK